MVARVRRDPVPATSTAVSSAAASELTKERSERMAAVRSDAPPVPRPKLTEARINALYAGARYRDAPVAREPQWHAPLTADRPWRGGPAWHPFFDSRQGDRRAVGHVRSRSALVQ